MKTKITKWQPDNFELEMTTHWSFPQRGDWATLERELVTVYSEKYYAQIFTRGRFGA